MVSYLSVVVFLFFLYMLFYFLLFWDIISLCSPGWPQSCKDPFASASQGPGLQVSATMPSSFTSFITMFCEGREESVWFRLCSALVLSFAQAQACRTWPSSPGSPQFQSLAQQHSCHSPYGVNQGCLSPSVPAEVHPQLIPHRLCSLRLRTPQFARATSGNSLPFQGTMIT